MKEKENIIFTYLGESVIIAPLPPEADSVYDAAERPQF